MPKKINIYVCSKPLQYLNVRNIAVRNGDTNILVFEPKFINANAVIPRVRDIDELWDEVLIVNNNFELFKTLLKHKPDRIFYYLDCFLGPSLVFHLLPLKELYIYEEGFGTYRVNIFAKVPFYKRMIRMIFYTADYPGFHVKTKGIYVYSPEYYRKVFVPKGYNKEILGFKTPFSKMLINNKDIASKVFGKTGVEAFRSRRLALFITSWKIKYEVLELIYKNGYDTILIKPHPHLKNVIEQKNYNNIIWLKTPNLVEIIISELIENGNSVDVYHDNSSSVLYLSDINKIHITNIGNKNEIFDQIVNGISKTI